MFIVDRDTPGFEVTRKLEKMGWRSSDTAELAYTDARGAFLLEGVAL